MSDDKESKGNLSNSHQPLREALSRLEQKLDTDRWCPPRGFDNDDPLGKRSNEFRETLKKQAQDGVDRLHPERIEQIRDEHGHTIFFECLGSEYIIVSGMPSESAARKLPIFPTRRSPGSLVPNSSNI